MIYEPREDSFLLEKQVRKFAKHRKVLDIGCGSGIQIEAALDSGAASALGVDIDKNSIDFCKSKGLNAIESNLFSKIDKQEKFNLIIFNPPYLPYDKNEGKDSSRATSGGKRGDEIIMRFLDEVNNYLESDGIILIVVSSLTPKKRINNKIRELNYAIEILDRENFFMERIEVWKLIGRLKSA